MSDDEQARPVSGERCDIGCKPVEDRAPLLLGVEDKSLGSPGTGARPTLLLRPLAPGDEVAARAAHTELLADGFSFLLDLRDGEPWSSYLERLNLLRSGRGGPEGWVPSTFLVAQVAGELVGRTSVRHSLSASLARWGGHIGYAVRPAFRRMGYATEILRQSLAIARALGVDKVLVTCDEGNAASSAVIERCGGVLEDVVPGEDGSPDKRRYWVEHVRGVAVP
jgi:predicted acetyltransferase